jgi:putative two-component system response regulator
MIEMVGALRSKGGVWSDAEVAQMRGHCEAGARLLARGGALVDDSAVRMARSHHERWDGGGYPHGLQGEAIPLEGRVAAIADALDAMTAHRSYRARLGWEEAISQLRSEAGTAFDPRLVEAAVRAEPELRQIAAFIKDA